MINIKEIANQAGISMSTVSRALNNPEIVKAETRERILSIVENMGYKPNPHARGLITGKTNLIALVLPTLNNPFFSQMTEGCQKYLVPKGYNLAIISSQEYTKKELMVFPLLDFRRYDGLILSASAFSSGDYNSSLEHIQIPMVLVEPLPDEQRFSSIYVDDITGMEIAIDHLMSKGHTEIGIIAGNRDLLITNRRMEAVRERLFDYHIRLRKSDIVYGNYSSLESGTKALHMLFRNGPKHTAILAFNDILAIGALKAAKELNLEVPQDLAIMGVDDIEMASYCSPSLTTVQAPSVNLGYNAAKLLLDQIDLDIVPIQKILLPVKLIIRGST